VFSLVTTTLHALSAFRSLDFCRINLTGDGELTCESAQAKWVPLSTSRSFRRRSRAMSFASFSGFAAGRSVNAPSKTVDGGGRWFFERRSPIFRTIVEPRLAPFLLYTR